MNLTDLDRIYFLRAVVWGYINDTIISDITHLGYMKDGDTSFFCSNMPHGSSFQIVQKQKPVSGKNCIWNIIKESDAILEQNNSECDEVTCPECLEIAIEGEIPEPIKELV